jgi:hypothetical protein
MKEIDSAAYGKTRNIMKDLFPIISDGGVLALVRNALTRQESELTPLEVVAGALYAHYKKVS